ncbi:MAG: hypothetical protein LBT83_11200 [Tannerella sp.]|jgi:hypothetical protein|nr:hypothetical protein [Tannerella sp.]
MSAKSDWLKHNHQALYNQANQTSSYMNNEENKVRMGLNGNINNWITGEFNSKHLAFSNAFVGWLDPALRTPMKITTLDKAEKDFIPVYRQLYTGVLRNNPLVTDADLVAMGFPKRPDNHREPVPDPTAILEVIAKTPSPGVVDFYFRIAGETGHAKPYGIQGYELCGGLFAEAPVNWSQLPMNYFSTTSPLHLAFEGNQRGRHFYFAARLENNRGVKGDWNEIQSVIIP